MRQSEARDLRSFLEEPVEEIMVEGVKGRSIDLQTDAMENVGARFTSPWGTNQAGIESHNVGAPFTSPLRTTPAPGTNSLSAPLQEAGVQFIPPWEGTNVQMQGSGVHFTTPWEGTGGQLHEVGARFTEPLGPLPRTTDDFTFQQTMPMLQIPDSVGAAFTTPTAAFTTPSFTTTPLRPYRLQRYQSRGVPVSLSRSTSGTLRLRPAGDTGRRETADLAPAPQKIVPGEPSPALQSWERRRRDIYAWLVLLLLFLLVVLGGIGLDSLIANYR